MQGHTHRPNENLFCQLEPIWLFFVARASSMPPHPVQEALDAAAILAGDRDAELQIERARRTREQLVSGVGKDCR